MNSPGIYGFGVIASCKRLSSVKPAVSTSEVIALMNRIGRPFPVPGPLFWSEKTDVALAWGALAQLSTAPLEWGYGALSEPASDLVGQPGSGPECCRRRRTRPPPQADTRRAVRQPADREPRQHDPERGLAG